MRKAKCIRESLYTSLFINSPSVNREEFLKEKYNIFPGERVFVEFLKTDDHQKRIEKSKQILLRLIFHHHFPVPSRLIFTLLELQMQKIPIISEGDYIGQDHFVHLVNLYLLGIYLFSYHKGLQTKCIKELNRLKRSQKNEKPSALYNIGSYRLFATLWAYFVLYHDVAYPLEHIKPNDRKNYGDIFQPFLNIEELIREDISLKTLAKLIAIKSIIFDKNTNSFKDLYLNYCSHFSTRKDDKNFIKFQRDCEPTDVGQKEIFHKFNNILKKWESASHIPSIEGMRSLKMVLSFFPPSKIGAVLERTDYGQPLAFVTYQDKETIFFEDHSKQNLVSKKRIDFWESAFRENSFQNSYLTWNYFILESADFYENLAPHLFKDKKGYFEHLTNFFNDNEEFRKLKRLEVDSADDLAFFCYYNLFTSRQYHQILGRGSDREKDYQAYLESTQKLIEKVPDYTSNCIENYLLKEIKNKNGKFLPHQIADENVDELAEYVIKFLCDNKPDIIERLNYIFKEKIKAPIELNQSIRKCLQHISVDILDKAFSFKSNENIFYPFSEIEINHEFDLLKIITDREEHLTRLNEYIKLHIGDINSQFLIKNYNPKWTKDPKYGMENGGFVDHGFAASLICLSANTINEEFLKYLDKFDHRDLRNDQITPTTRALWLNYGMTSKEDLAVLKLLNDFISSEVVSTIFLHNFYPQEAPHEINYLPNYRTNRNTQPFPYIAFLSDGIQKWDRTRLANQAKVDLKKFVPGSLYDIRVKESLIEIYISISSLDKDVEEKHLGDVLEESLKGIKSFIEIKSL